MKKSLDKKLESEIQSLGKKGREAWSKGNLPEAEAAFLQCWAAIPEPKFDYDYSQILSRGLVKFYRNSAQIEKAKNWITVMKEAYGPEPDLDSDFLAATVDYEANELDKAYQVFRAQYELYGSRPFEGEDKKYIQFTIKRSQGE